MVRVRPCASRDTLRFCALAALPLAALGTIIPTRTSAAPPDSAIAVPDAPRIPALLSLREALRIFRGRGLDLLIADAATLSAAGELMAAGAVAGPNVSVEAGPTFNYNARAPGCTGCQDFGVQWSVGDSGALLDVITAKRALRLRGAREALLAARAGRKDIERTLAAQVKQAYYQVAAGQAVESFSVSLVRSMEQTLDLNERRFKAGSIHRASLVRITVQKLEADQALSHARQGLRQAQIALAFLLGVRGPVPAFAVEQDALAYRVPSPLIAQSEAELIERAFAHRPDLQQQKHLRRSAEHALELAGRQRFPIVQLSLTYNQFGNGQQAASPQNLAAGAAFDFPVFYQQQGELRRADAALRTQALTEQKTAAQVVSDIGTALITVQVARRQIERLQSLGLPQARIARDIIELQYQKGAASLMDFLDAERTFIGTNLELIQDQANYWSAVSQLEQALGEELE